MAVTPTITGHATSVSNGTGATFTVNPSTNVVGTPLAVGNWMMIVFTSSSGTFVKIPTKPPEWTEVHAFGQVGTGTTSFGVWAKIRQVGETTYTFSQSADANGTVSKMIWGTGSADPSQWVLGSFVNRSANATTLTTLAPAITTTTSHTLAVVLSHDRTTASETDAQVTCTNFTKAYTDLTIEPSLLVGTKDMVVAGDTGSVTTTYPNTHAQNGIAGIVGITPDPSILPIPVIGTLLTDTGGTTSAASITLNPSLPTKGVAPLTNDWMIAMISVNTPSGDTITAPAGWTPVRDDWGTIGTYLTKVFAKKREAGDTSYTFNVTNARHLNASMLWMRGVADVGAWIVGTPKARATAPSESVTISPPSITTTTADTFVLALGFERTNAAESSVAWSGMSELFFEPSTGLCITTHAVGFQTVASPGVSATTVITYPNTQVVNGWGFQIGIPKGTTLVGLPLKISNGTSLTDARLQVSNGSNLVVPGGMKVLRPGYSSVTQMLAQDTFHVAHRGGSRDFPEMSLYAYGQSALIGYGALELSLARTSDGVWFGLHDASLDRTSGVTGQTASTMTWAQVQTYNILGSTATGNPTQANRPYMRWEELMALYYPSHVIFVDPKAAFAFRAELLNMMDAMPGTPTDHFVAKYYGVVSNWPQDATARGYKGWGYFYQADAANFATYQGRWDILGMDYGADQATWDAIKAYGKPVIGHICPTPAAAATALAKGANGLMMSGTKATVPGAELSHTALVDALYTGGTVSFSVNVSTPTLSGTLVPPNDSRFKLKGAGGWAFGPSFPDTLMYRPSSKYPNTYGQPSSCGAEFMFTGQRFEVYFKHIAGSGMIRVKINGRRVTDLFQATGAVTNGSRYYYKVDLGQIVTNARITLEFSSVPFGGIVPDTGATVSGGVPVYNSRVIVQGDSISGGSALNTGISAGTYVLRLADYMGWDDIWNESIGGTGYVEPGTSVNILDAARINDVTANSPTHIFLWAGYNDSTTSVTTAASSIIDQYKAAHPSVPIYVIGTWSPNSVADSARTNRDIELEAVAQAKNCFFISPITGRLRNPAGTLIATVTHLISNTADMNAYIGADNIHPNDAGHNHIAKWLYDALRRF